MAWYSNLLSTGLDKIISSAGDALDKLFTSKDEQQKNELAKAQIQATVAQVRNEMEKELDQLYVQDLQNLRKEVTAELQNQDPYVRRSRPTFNYVFYVIIVLKFVLYPLLEGLFKLSIPNIVIPDQLWWVFGTGFIGYGYLRTVEKTSKKAPVPLRDK